MATNPVSHEQHEEVLNSIERLHEKLARMEERLRHHCDEEHKSFDSAVKWIDGQRALLKLLVAISAVVGGAASAWGWVTGNFDIKIK